MCLRPWWHVPPTIPCLPTARPSLTRCVCVATAYRVAQVMLEDDEIDVLVERLHLSAKAETALKKACKHRTTKGAPGFILPHGGPAPFRRPRRDQRYQVG